MSQRVAEKIRRLEEKNRALAAALAKEQFTRESMVHEKVGTMKMQLAEAGAELFRLRGLLTEHTKEAEKWKADFAWLNKMVADKLGTWRPK